MTTGVDPLTGRTLGWPIAAARSDIVNHVVERSFRLEAPSGLGAKPRPELIGPVLTHLRDTLQDAVRMGFLHSSRARGRIPHDIKAAAEVRYIGHAQADGGEGATLLRFEVAPFGEAAAGLFAQTQLWDDGPRPEQTAFELLGAALDDVGSRRAESNRFDPNLLRRIAGYRRMFGRGVLSRIVLPDSALPQSPRLDAEIVLSARALSDATPKPRRVRVTGRLDLMGASQGVLKIHVGPNGLVTALWDGDEPIDGLTTLFNRAVVCEGLGVFRPSGSLLRIDADAIALAGAQDAAFGHVPRAVPTSDIGRAMRLRSSEAPVYAAFLGSVPAEETEEEFVAAVEAMS